MNHKGKAVCALLLVQLLAWGVFVPSADAGKLIRLSAQFRYFNEGEAGTSATAAAGGLVIYTKSFSIPTPAKSSQRPVVFITVTGTGDVHGGESLLMSCAIDGAFCNPQSSGAAAGWVNLLTDEADLHDNAVHYTWCAQVSPGSHTATVRMASAGGADDVFLDAAHFFIDRTEFTTSSADDCEQGA